MAIFNTRYCGEVEEPVFVWWSPRMTAANSPAPYTVTAKGFNNSAYGYGAPYYAFDDKAATGWYHSSSTGTWIQINFGKDISLDGVSVKPANDSNVRCIPKNIKVIGIVSDGTTIELSTLYPPNEYVWTTGVFDRTIKVQGIRLESNSGSYDGYSNYVIGEIKFRVHEEVSKPMN